MAEVEIRVATPADAADLQHVIVAAYAPYAAAGLDLPPVSEGVADVIAQDAVWVATHGPRIVGGIMATLGQTAHIINLAVDPQVSGGGIGRALIDTVVAAARDAGAAQLALATHAQMTRTIGFYQRLGWVETARTGNKVMMSKPLSY